MKSFYSCYPIECVCGGNQINKQILIVSARKVKDLLEEVTFKLKPKNFQGG